MKTPALITLRRNHNISSRRPAQNPAWQPSPGYITLPLWPNGAPGAEPNPQPEIDTTKPTDNLIAGRPLIRLGNVSSSTLTLYQPSSGKNGAAPAVVVFPGGGYQILAIDLEGTEVCDWLNSIGVTCVLVKYRVPNTGPYPKSPAALQDAQRALGLVRQHAVEWGHRSQKRRRAWLLGWRASGRRPQHPFRQASLRSHRRCRSSSVAVPISPSSSIPATWQTPAENMAPNPDISPTAQTPPTFIVQAENDPVHVENATNYFLQLKAVKVPAELHIYAEGGHGYGLRRTGLPVTTWPDTAAIWLHTINVLSSTGGESIKPQ